MLNSSKDSHRIVVFRVHSPFTLLLTSLIGEFYYKDAKRVGLIPVGFNPVYREGMLESGLFDEIYTFRDAEGSVLSVEQEVDAFLNRYSEIDEYFFNTLHDRFGYLLACRLHGKTLVNLYPEGCGHISFQKGQEVGTQEFYAKFSYMNQFYEKYPMDFRVIDVMWNFDGNLPEEDTGVQLKKVDFHKLFFLGESLIKQLNALFHFSGEILENYDAFYLDSGLAEKNRIDTHAEKVILDELFANLSGKKILVKPHPGQSAAYINFQFANRDADILFQSEIPWELIYFNLLLRKTRKKVVLIMFSLTTTVYSSIHIVREDDELVVLSLENLEKPYIEPSVTRRFSDVARYYDYVLKGRNNIHIYAPDNFKALQKHCAQIFDGAITAREPLEDCALSAISLAQFFRIGNLFAKSRIYEKRSGKMYEALFDFTDETSEIVFPVYGEVDFSTLKWWPDEWNMFFNFKALQVYVEEEDGREFLTYSSQEDDGEAMIIRNDGSVLLSIPYRGFCGRLRIRVKLRTRETYSQLAKMYGDMRWRAAFWENWHDIQTSGRLQTYVQKAGIREVWIFGPGKIGVLIKKAFDELAVSTKFLATKGKKEPHVRVYEIRELNLETETPDAVVITPMWDYTTILYSLPPDLRKKALSLEEFTSAILDGRGV